jgi:hypothetical protein
LTLLVLDALEEGAAEAGAAGTGAETAAGLTAAILGGFSADATSNECSSLSYDAADAIELLRDSLNWLAPSSESAESARTSIRMLASKGGENVKN